MRRMWQIYGVAWFIYTLLISFVIQLENIERGKFIFEKVLMAFTSNIPFALMLALVWPLSGYLERSGASTRRVADMHFAAAMLVGICSHLWDYEVMRVLVYQLPRKSLSWYIWPFMYSLMMYGVVAGLFHAVRASQASRVQALAVSQAQSLQMTAELMALRNKLNPHFLFNTLNSIIALVRKDARAAESALFRFSDMLRYLLDTEKSGSDRVTLEDELEFVRNYLDLESLRLGSRLQVEWDTDPEALSVAVPALSIQPLVENSIKHAFNPRSQPGTLRIACHLAQDGKGLEVAIRDDGPGADPQAVARASGMGIKTVERRLQLAYGARSRFIIDTAPGRGFGINLTLPVDN